ncbi:MAG: hypothetical protein NUV74_16925, partial [Candidatus Brocadiaceae bacterium]|nr:hypothetical protein [Candidatus Brocadiaceae bacterium]
MVGRAGCAACPLHLDLVIECTVVVLVTDGRNFILPANGRVILRGLVRPDAFVREPVRVSGVEIRTEPGRSGAHEEVGHRESGVVEHEVIVCIAVCVAQVACGAGGIAPRGHAH